MPTKAAAARASGRRRADNRLSGDVRSVGLALARHGAGLAAGGGLGHRAELGEGPGGLDDRGGRLLGDELGRPLHARRRLRQRLQQRDNLVAEQEDQPEDRADDRGQQDSPNHGDQGDIDDRYIAQTDSWRPLTPQIEEDGDQGQDHDSNDPPNDRPLLHAHSTFTYSVLGITLTTRLPRSHHTDASARNAPRV